jgi:hypothetical protein
MCGIAGSEAREAVYRFLWLENSWPEKEFPKGDMLEGLTRFSF